MRKCESAKAGICLLVLIGVAMVGCSRKAQRSGLKDLLNEQKGNVLILLLGVEGCPGTMRATTILDDYADRKPAGVSIVRLDVPHSGKRLAEPPKHKFPCYVDHNRSVASDLEFVYYPTLYIFDGDGTKRFVGGCNETSLPQMVTEILAEKPGDKKKIYTRELPAIGSKAPDLSGVTGAGDPATFDSLAGTKGLILFFSRTTCPFSKAELPELKRLQGEFAVKGIAFAVVSRKEGPEADAIYTEQCPGIPVIRDKDDKISEAYGVEVTPFFYLLRSDKTVAEHAPFTYSAAQSAINAMLGLAPATPVKPSGHG